MAGLSIDSGAARGEAVARVGRLGALREEFWEFVSPFKTPAFRWLWLQGFVGTMGGIIQGYFTYYWFQDSIAPHGFFLFTHKVTSHPQSAVSINGMVGAIVNSAVSWSGNYWCERTGGQDQLLFAV